MTRKTKITLGLAALLAVSAVSGLRQYQQVRQADELHSALTGRLATLKTAVAGLKSELTKDARARALALAKVAGDGATYIPVKSDIISKFISPLVDRNFKLTAQAAGLLGLTPDQTAKLQDVLMEMKDQVQSYQRASLRGISADDLDNPDMFNSMTQPMAQTRFGGPNAQGVRPDPVTTYIPKAPGDMYIYEVPPMSDQGLAALQDWFSSRVADAIGSDRADVVVTAAGQSNDFWLQSGEYMIIAFMDRSGVGGSNFSSQSECSVHIYSGHGGQYSSGGTSVDAIAPQWAYLFQDPADDAAPAAK